MVSVHRWLVLSIGPMLPLCSLSAAVAWVPSCRVLVASARLPESAPLGGAGLAAHEAIVAAITHVLAHGPHTRDLGGQASTVDVGRAIAARLEAQ